MTSQRKRTALQAATCLVVLTGLLILIISLTGSDPLELGRLAFKEGNYSEATRHLARAVAQQPGNAEIYRELGNALGLVRKFEQAAEAFHKAMERNPGDLDLVRCYGLMLILGGEKEIPPCMAAETFARRYIQMPENKDSPFGFHILGKALHKRYILERDKLVEQVKERFEGPYVWDVVGTINNALNATNFLSARTDLTRNLKRLVNLPSSDPLFELIGALRRTQDEALIALREAQNRDGHHGYPVFEEAKLLQELGKKDKSEALARSLIQASGDTIHEEIKIEAQRLLATILQTAPDSDRECLREAARNWGAYLFGLDKLLRTHREKNLLRFEAHDARGELFIRMKSPVDIREVADSLLSLDKNDPSGLFYKGMAAYFEGNDKEAEINLTASLNKRHDFICYMTLGRILSAKSSEVSQEQALCYFRQAGKLNPRSVEPILAEARHYFNKSNPNYIDAFKKIRRAISKDLWFGKKTEEIIALRDQVEIALLKKNRKESYKSIQAAQKALDLDPRSPYPLYLLAIHHEKQGDLKLARQYARRLQKYAKDSMLAKLIYARILLQMGRQMPPGESRAFYEEAEVILSQAQDLDPTDVRPISLASKVAKAAGNGAKYWRLLCRAVEVNPQDVESRLEIAWLTYKTDFKSARYYLDLALRNIKTPSYDVMRLDLEISLMEGKLEKAEKDLAWLKNTRSAPPGDYFYYQGKIAELRGKTLQAIDWYTQGNMAEPDRGDLVVAAANLEIRSGDPDAAFHRLTAFRKKGGKHSEVSALLGKHYFDQWELVKARDLYSELLSLSGNDRRGHLGYGRCAMYLGSRLEGDIWRLLSQVDAVSRDKDGKEKARDILISGIYGYLDIHQWKLALERLKHLDRLMPHSPFRNRSLLAYFNGDFPSTRQFVRQGLESQPKAPFLRFLRALLAIKDQHLEGTIDDVTAIIPDLKPCPPWKEYATRVARKRPGFGRMVLATVAEVHLLKDRIEAARDILEIGTRAYPGNARLEYLQAHVHLRMNRRDEALDLLTNIPDTLGMDAVRDQGIILALKKDRKSIPLMEQYAASNAMDGSKLLAWARFEVGDEYHTDVLRMLRKNPRWRWDIPDQVLLAGLSNLVDGPERALGQIPDQDSLVGPYLQKLLLSAPTGKRARPFFRMWEDLIRGLVLFHLPFFQTQSAWHLENVLAVDPEHPLFLDLVGRLQIQAGDLGSARDTYGRIRSHEDQALKLLGLSRILSHEKSGRNRARKELEKALELKPRAGELFIELGALLLEMDLPHEAASILTRGIDTVSDARRNPRLHSLLARALERVGDASGASAKYLYALTLDPNDRYLAYRRVKLLLASDDYPAAMVILAHLPALTRTYPDIKLSLGLALFNQGYLKQARKELRGFPYSAKAAFCLGKINHKEGKKQEAIKWYQYAQSLDPVEHLDALLVVVEIYREEYRFREALEVINLFLAYAPLSARGRTIQAEILESLFRNDRALFEWITAWKLDKKNPRPILKIAILLRKKGEMKVHEALIKYLDRWPTPLPMILKRALEKERLFHRK